jgi:hypothetical protein
MISAYFQRPESSTIQMNIRENLANVHSRETGNIGYILHTTQKNKKDCYSNEGGFIHTY